MTIIKTSSVFSKNQKAKTRIVVDEGSARSTKSYSIIQLLIALALQEKLIVTICRARLTWLKATAYLDFLTILREQFKIYDPKSLNKTELVYTLPSESSIRFWGLDETQKLHGYKSDVLWLNEAMEVDKSAFTQLAMRTTQQIFLDYNPSAETHWIYDSVIPRDDCTFIKSTYKDNPFLEQSIIDEIERLEPTEHNIKMGTADEVLWKIYGLGERAAHRGLIFGDTDIVKDLPPKEEWKKHAYGIDFGYTCLDGNTIVETSYGKKKIKDIKIGDKVLSRNGFCEVREHINNGFKDVFELSFGFGKSIIVTGDHRIFTSEGWKRVDELQKEETLCFLKLSLMGKFIKSIQKNILANFVKLNLWVQHITHEIPVLKSVQINLRSLREKREVFDISTDCREFFANGLLVHNCDPTALSLVVLCHGELYFKQLLYERKLVNRKDPKNPKQMSIEQRFEELKIPKEAKIWSDAAEPKTIQDLNNAGWFNLRAADKGPDSIVNGIQNIKRYKTHITEDSIDAIKEKDNYKWIENKEGNTTNKPIDAFNHFWDSVRYPCSMDFRLVYEDKYKAIAPSQKLKKGKTLEEKLKYYENRKILESVF